MSPVRSVINETDAPTISIIIPTYNRSELVGRAMRSALTQTHENIEIIVVDDGSSDNTGSVVESLDDERISCLRHPLNRGLPAARNTGIRRAQGEYVAFLDDDDVWLPNKLAKQVERFRALSNRNVGLIYSGYTFVSSENGEKLKKIAPFHRGYVYVEMLEKSFLSVTTALIKRTCFDKIGLYDENLPSCEDVDFLIRLSKEFEFDYVPESLTNVYVHRGHMSAELDSKIRAKEIIVEKHLNALSRYPQILAQHLARIGILHCLADRPQSGRMYLKSAIRIYPKIKKNYIHFCLTILFPGIHRFFFDRFSVSRLDGIEFY